MNTALTVPAEHQGKRLDLFLVERFSQYSRTRIQQMVVDGCVTVNGNSVAKHYFLKVDDRIEVNEAPAAAKEPAVTRGQAEHAVTVLFEDDALIVLEKPAGMLVHGVAGSTPEYTLADFLVSHVPTIVSVGESGGRPGIVHRLDRDVSGVLVAAKTAEAYEALKRQFQARTIEKEYRGIVHGVPPQDHGVIRFKIARSKTHGGKMAARPEHEEGRDAWTEYDVLERMHNRYALLSVHIKTGRTHQIRAHLAAIDHPVVGDSIYTTKKYAEKKYPRLFLHSYRLALTHPAHGERVEFTSSLPESFAAFLRS